MDPLTALGLAGNIIQVVDFSGRMLSRIWEIYHSDSGETQNSLPFRLSASRLRDSHRRLTQILAPEGLKCELSATQLDILELSEECSLVGKELIEALDKVNSGGEKKKWPAIRQGIKSVWHEADIKRLRDRLENARQMLTTSILVDLQQQMVANRKESDKSRTDTLTWGGAQSIQHWLKAHGNETRLWQANLLKAVTRSNAHLMQSYNNLSRAVDIYEKRKQETRSQQLLGWHETPVAQSIMDSLIDALWFEDMNLRQESISEAFAETYDWIFEEPVRESEDADPPWSSFRNWLTTGDGLYWIAGKAGSGKSTLMKLIFNDSRTERMLREWSSKAPLITAAFFFWNAGTALQMSKEGLLRSLLHQALSRRRDLKDVPPPSALEAFSLSKDFYQPWTWTELVQVFRFLIEAPAGESAVNYAFFVDGLDEFEGDKSELVSLVLRLSSFPNVKICTSSRPWSVFEDAFRQSASLSLQYCTYDDIRHYVEQTLSAHPGFHELSCARPGPAQELVGKITSKASGVFLWVVLVVRSLLEGLTDGDSLTDLQRRLESLPEKLEQLFKSILDSLSPAYFRYASHVFQLIRSAKAKLRVLTLSFADEESEYAFEREVAALSREELYYRAVNLRRRLNGRCKGLVEIVSSQVRSGSDSAIKSVDKALRERHDMIDGETDPNLLKPSLLTNVNVDNAAVLATAKVEYLHRTVKDFLEQPDIWSYIQMGSAENFDPNASLCRSFLIQLKTLSPSSIFRAGTLLWDDISWCLEYAAALQSDDLDLTVRILDEVDKAAAQLLKAKDKSGRSYIQRCGRNIDDHWVATVAGFEKTDRFWNFAAKCHLLEYVQVKLPDLSLGKDDYSKLLYSTVAKYQMPFSLIGRTVCCRNDPDPRLVRLCLSNGADPKAQFEDGSALQVAGQYSTRAGDDGPWKDIVNALKDYVREKDEKAQQQEPNDSSNTNNKNKKANTPEKPSPSSDGISTANSQEKSASSDGSSPHSGSNKQNTRFSLLPKTRSLKFFRRSQAPPSSEHV